MEPSEFDYNKHSISIPEIFRSSETGLPINHCLVCNTDLLKLGTSYMIEKAIRQVHEIGNKEVIFEYAMCVPCMMKMQESLSKESKDNISRYFEENTNFSERRRGLILSDKNEVEPWIEHCIIKGTPISQSKEYQLVGHCDGDRLLFTYMPFALSIEAMDEIASLLSAKSLGEMDDFIGDYFSGPPEIAEILRKRPVVLL